MRRPLSISLGSGSRSVASRAPSLVHRLSHAVRPLALLPCGPRTAQCLGAWQRPTFRLVSRLVSRLVPRSCSRKKGLARRRCARQWVRSSRWSTASLNGRLRRASHLPTLFLLPLVPSNSPACPSHPTTPSCPDARAQASHRLAQRKKPVGSAPDFGEEPASERAKAATEEAKLVELRSRRLEVHVQMRFTRRPMQAQTLTPTHSRPPGHNHRCRGG